METRVDASANTRVDDSGNTRVTTTGFPISDANLTLLDAARGAAHRDGSVQVVYVLKLSPYNLATRASEDLYFSSTRFADSTIGNTLGRMIPPNVRVSILNGDRIGQDVSVTRGSILIHNPRESHFDRNDALTADRGRYDSLRKGYSWAGRPLEVYLGPEDGAFADDFDLYFSAVIEDFNWGERGIEIRPGPATVDLDEAVQKNFYGQGYVVEVRGPKEEPGVTISPSSASTKFEGGVKTEYGGGGGSYVWSITVFDDLSGTPLPLLYGYARGIEPQAISRSSEIYQFHGRQEVTVGNQVESLDAVYEDGLQMTEVTDYGIDLTRASFRLEDATTGIITADAKGALAGPSDTYIDRPGDILQAVLYDHIGLTPADIASDTFGQYDQQYNYESGFYFGSEIITRKEFFEAMLSPLGFPYRGRDGRLRIGYAREPDGATPDVTLDEGDIASIRRVNTLEPAWRVRVGYQPVGRVIEMRDFLGAVSEGEKARQSQEYRWVEAIDPGAGEFHKAAELEFKTRYTTRANAQTIADQCLALYGKPRDIIEVQLLKGFMSYEVGDIVRVGWQRYDFIDDGNLLQEDGFAILLEDGTSYLLKEEYSDGKNYLVVGYVDDPANDNFTLTLWG